MTESVHKKGFTLIELLMVIAIIAILSSILVAGISRVRGAAHLADATSSARAIITAFLLTASDNNGQYMMGYGDAGQTLRPNGFPPILSSQEHARRYPWRLVPYLSDSAEVLYVGENRNFFKESAGNSAYHTSLYPSFGINSIFVGGHYDGRKHSPNFTPSQRSRDKTKFPNRFWVLRPADAVEPAKMIVFASSISDTDGDGKASGYFKVTPPKSPLSPTWGPYKGVTDPGSMGNVSLEYGGGALVANLDGSVTVLDEEDLRDMRRWSNQAAFYSDKDFNNWNK